MSNSIHDAASKGYETAGESYEKGRPEYPRDAVNYLSKEIGVLPGRTILDLGAGTGKFTKLIANFGADVIAVEPVAGMRKKFSDVLPKIAIQAGTAENIPLQDCSVDAVVVAQAFHWFNGEKSLPEIFRVLKPGGRLGLIWNARDESIDWVSRLTDIIDPHEKGAPRYKYGVWKKSFESTPLFSPLTEKHFRYVQKGDHNMVVDRVASISFISALEPALNARVLGQVNDLLTTHPETRNRQEIELPYRTDVFVCSKI